MADNLLAETLSSPSHNMLENTLSSSHQNRPPHVPEKFWDASTQSIRTEALLKSYSELEKKLSTGKGALINTDVPEKAEEYNIQCSHGFFDPDQDINQRMLQLGFTTKQAQFVYDLAAERMVPLIQEMAAEFQADREIERLKSHFGGEDKWRDMARQILSWAKRNLPTAAVEGLSTTYEGVMSMYQMMMANGESATLGRQNTLAAEEDPSALIKDPRYWRDRDPSFVNKVTEGFTRKYKD